MTVAAARAADDHQRELRVVERGERADREVGALQPLDPPDEQQHPRRVDAEPLARRVAVAGKEDVVVDAGRHDFDAIERGVVQRCELRALVVRRREHQVGARDHFVLDPRAVLGVVVDAGFGLHPGERVERRDEREVELVLQPVRDRAREPVVAVQHVDRLALEHAGHGRVDEGLDQLGERVLRYGCARAGLDVQHAKAGLDLHDRGLGAVLGAGVDVALDAGPGQRARERPHVHVHAAAVAGTGLCERRRVHREHGDPADGHRVGS